MQWAAWALPGIKEVMVHQVGIMFQPVSLQEVDYNMGQDLECDMRLQSMKVLLSALTHSSLAHNLPQMAHTDWIRLGKSYKKLQSLQLVCS